MKMQATDKATLIGGICLLFIMLIQMYGHSQIDANNREYRNKQIEFTKKNLADSGFSESQAGSIINAVRDESFSMQSSLSSEAVMQPYMTTMSCLIVLIMTNWAIKKTN